MDFECYSKFNIQLSIYIHLLKSELLHLNLIAPQ